MDGIIEDTQRTHNEKHNGHTMLVVAMGLTLAFNILIIYVKFRYDRYGDALLDTAALVTLAIVFGSSTQALMIGTIASAIISIFLYFFPPNGQSKPSEPLIEADEEDKAYNFKRSSNAIIY